MSAVTVRALAEDEWELYRSVRLAALQESPEAFADTYENEQGLPESAWRERMSRDTTRLVAELDARPVGVVSVAPALRAQSEIDNPDDPERAEAHARGSMAFGGVEEAAAVAELFGLWVPSQHRGKGISVALAKAAARNAQGLGRTHIVYWVGSDNGRAVAFASGLGFLPTDSRRPMRRQSDDEDEVAMVLPLHADRGFLDED